MLSNISKQHLGNFHSKLMKYKWTVWQYFGLFNKLFSLGVFTQFLSNFAIANYAQFKDFKTYNIIQGKGRSATFKTNRSPPPLQKKS